MNQFADVLKANNLKSTHQRLTILQHVDQFGHVDIDTLYEAILKKYPTISKATLYRNINDLLSFHIIEEVKLPNHKQQYEIKKVPHVHLLCTACGSVEDIFVPIQKFLETIEEESGFTINSSFVVMNGVCSSCKKLSN